jgi:ABC-type nitrate/sulfonate/bicarbonate transport system ATPase subunit
VPRGSIRSQRSVASAEILRLEGVRKSYGSGTPVETEVLHGIDLRLQAGEFAALIGPSGSGKSTLLHAIGLLERPTTGRIFVNGEDATVLDDRAVTALRGRALGFVFQFHHLIPAFSALENVMMPLLLDRGRRDAEMAQRARELLAEVGLADALDKRPAELSGGMQQRVAIARALACRPDVILMDEPFSSVDALTRVGLQELVLRLWRELGLTIVLVTHDVEEAIYLSTRVVALSKAPAMVAVDLPIELPHPRDQITTREQPRYLEYRHHLLQQLFRAEGIESVAV